MFIICQYFQHLDPARAAEFEVCIRENIRNGHQLILFEEQPAPDDIRNAAKRCIAHPERLTYSHALNWANRNLESGSIVALINLDVIIQFSHFDVAQHLQQYPNHFLCLSRLEYDPRTGAASLNEHLESARYMNCQDAWVFRTPIPELALSDFAVGNCPGCDNAIAFRAAEAGLIPINLADSFPIWHYDFVRPKNPHTMVMLDSTTVMTVPERHGRLFLPRIAIGGRLKQEEILEVARLTALGFVEQDGYTDRTDALMSNYLACRIALCRLPLPWDLRYLYSCIAMNNGWFMNSASRST